MFIRSLRYLYELRSNLKLSPSELEERQWKRFKAIIKHAYDNVPFYREKFNKAKIKPDGIKSRLDLAKIPTTTRAELQTDSLNHFVARNVDPNKCRKMHTSGSTGTPLTILSDGEVVDFQEALWTRAYLANGLRASDKMLIIRDPAFFPRKQWIQNLGIMRRKYVSVFETVEQQMRTLEDYRADAIKGYPTSLTALANAYDDRPNREMPRIVFTGSELLDAKSREKINSVFQTELSDMYGSIEFSLLAWECPEHTGYHINVDSVLMEFLREEEAINLGQDGEIVCTSLVNYTMPLIRYKTDDIGILSNETCQSHVNLPLMKVIEGRSDDFLVTLNGRAISPLVFFPYPFDDDDRNIKQFRIIQDKPDRLIFQLATKKEFNINTTYQARKRIQQLFGKDMQVEFEITDKLERQATGKIKVISRTF